MFTPQSFAALIASLALAASWAPTADARGNAEAGAEKALVCTACHGATGNSPIAEWPSLAGQNTAYLREQLTLFRAGHRNNEVMYPLAIALTDEDIDDLAAYFAAQTPTGLEADPSNFKVGERLYRGGDRERNIPSCTSCHGPVGLGNSGAAYPALRGQHAEYTVKQLADYAAGQRYLDVNSGEPTRSRNGHMMTSIAKRLTQEDMEALASYIQGLR